MPQSKIDQGKQLVLTVMFDNGGEQMQVADIAEKANMKIQEVLYYLVELLWAEDLDENGEEMVVRGFVYKDDLNKTDAVSSWSITHRGREHIIKEECFGVSTSTDFSSNQGETP